MSKTILKIKNKYVVWSSVVDAPSAVYETAQELKEYLKHLVDDSSLQEIVELTEKTGCSHPRYSSVEEFIAFNRAGPHEECLTLQQIIDMYIDDVGGK
jgi:hypothetical protein